MSEKKDSKPVKHSQGGLMLWHGMTIGGLIRFFSLKPALHWSRLHKILSLPFSGLYNSVLGALESLIYGRAVQKTVVEKPPIFIVGYWRSGTTLLHNLLSKDENFQHLTMYKGLFPWHFLISEKIVSTLTAPFVPEHRPMDNMKISWKVPQEDDFALCIMSQVSPMLIISHPHDTKPFWDAIDFRRISAKALERWKSSLRLLLKKMTYADPRQIVLKSPVHVYHMPLLAEMYPGARFLFIHRHPCNVFRSGIHLRRRAIEENCLGRVPFEGHEEEVLRSMKLADEVYMRDREEIADNRLVEICYEELEKNPVEVLRSAYKTLELDGFDDVEPALQAEFETMKQYRKNQFQDDPEWSGRVCAEMKEFMDRYGYQPPEAAQEESGQAPEPKATAIQESV